MVTRIGAQMRTTRRVRRVGAMVVGNCMTCQLSSLYVMSVSKGRQMAVVKGAIGSGRREVSRERRGVSGGRSRLREK
jgi:hypothetical protein